MLLGLTYASALPPFEAADEGAHFLYTHNLLETGEFPVIVSREVVAEQTDPTQLWAIETHQPPLYYAIGALLISWTDRSDINDYLRTNDLIFVRGVTEANHNQWLHSPTRGNDGDTALALTMLRGYSLVLGALTLWFIYLASRVVFAELGMTQSWLPVLPMLMVASVPTFISISSSYNNDNLVTTLYAGGVYWVVRMWHKREITRFDMLAVSVIFVMIALTKINGLTLIGVVYLSLFVGVWRGYYSRRSAIGMFGISMLALIVFAGWWYLRNWDLYGDPLALSATQSLWGREFEIAATSGDIGAELTRIYRSFWFMIGYLHLPVYGPAWLYVYAGVVAIIGLIGASWVSLTRLTRADDNHAPHDYLVLLAGVCAIVVATLLIGTRSVDISYGRLLFPALIGFAPLVIIGLMRLLRTIPYKSIIVTVLILPLTIVAIMTPFTTLSDAYPRIETVETIPESANQINVSAEGLTLIGVNVSTDVVHPDGNIDFDIYLRGRHPDNPFLMVTAIDAITLEQLGHVEIFPGIAPMDGLNPESVYRAHVELPLDEIELPLSPRRVDLRFGWHSLETFADIPMTDGAGQPIDTVIIAGTTLIDDRYDPPTPQVTTDVQFGDVIGLTGYDLNAETLSAGELLMIDLHWAYLNPMDEDWVLTVQLFSADGTFIMQSDGEPAGYSTSWWRSKGSIYSDQRVLDLPDDLETGAYQLYLGWYRRSDLLRLSVVGDNVQSDLVVLPTTITIVNDE